MDRVQRAAPFSLQVDLRQVVYALSASLDLVGIGDVAPGEALPVDDNGITIDGPQSNQPADPTEGTVQPPVDEPHLPSNKIKTGTYTP